ncbi:MAG: hypothetical protein LBT69_04450 [Lactobacillales bacterium]|jgi:GTPase SAR1 family protein|nr:hypothetical protein [Lactobacillales bacterium]
MFNKDWFLKISKILVFCTIITLLFLLIFNKVQAVDQYNVGILGDTSTTKIDFIKRLKYINDECIECSIENQVNNCYTLKVNVIEQSRKVILNLWDIAGQKKYIQIAAVSYLSRASAFIILFDLSKSETLSTEWIEFAKQMNSKAYLFLVGLEKEKLSDNYYRKIKKFANEQNIKYFPVSVTSQSGMYDLISEVAIKCLESTPQESHCNSDLEEKNTHKCMVF